MNTLTDEGFFISPCGYLIPVVNTHIGTVVAYPAAFGLTIKAIDAAYKRAKERPYCEGRARDKLLTRVLKGGWIRLRRHRQRWSVQCGSLDPTAMAAMSQWAAQIRRGIGGYVEKDQYIDVALDGLGDGTQQRMTVKELASAVPSGQQKLKFSSMDKWVRPTIPNL